MIYYKMIIVEDIVDGQVFYRWYLRDPLNPIKKWILRKALNWCEKA